MRNPTGRPLAPLALLILAVGCGETTDPGPLTAGRADSAGVELVHNRGVGIRWLDLDRELRIGEVEGDGNYMFDQIRDVDRHEDGRLLVADNNSLKIYDGTGHFIRQMGGRGDGPGEFQFLGSGWWSEGQVRAFDIIDGSNVTFDTLGNVLSDRTLQGEAYTTPEMVTEFSGRTLGLVIQYTGGPVEGRRLVYLGTVVELDPLSGEVTDVSDPFPVGTGMATEYGESSSPAFDTIIRPALVDPDHFLASSGTGYSIDLRRMDGSLVRRVSRDFIETRIDSEAQDYYERAMRFLYDDSPMRAEEMDGVLSRGPDLDRIPPVAGILSVKDGGFWVARNDLYADPVAQAIGPASEDWSREGFVLEYFDATGEYLGTVRFPPDFSPRQFESDRVIGVERDSPDVQYVVVYRITSLD